MQHRISSLHFILRRVVLCIQKTPFSVIFTVPMSISSKLAMINPPQFFMMSSGTREGS